MNDQKPPEDAPQRFGRWVTYLGASVLALWVLATFIGQEPDRQIAGAVGMLAIVSIYGLNRIADELQGIRFELRQMTHETAAGSERVASAHKRLREIFDRDS